MHGKYVEMPCVGAYVDGAISKMGTGDANIAAGKDSKWGNKRIAVIQTSDARDRGFVKLGTHPTWIKWAEPTAEALRQACLAQESRIAHSEPALPHSYITRLSVSNSKYMGPVELELNLQYNAIIGGRGTGKSTCLEYLRWALCDHAATAQVGLDDIPDHAARRTRLIQETLAPLQAVVDVHFNINAIPHVVRRHADGGNVELKVGDLEFVDAAPPDIQKLLAIDAYSQKQLSSVGVRIDELTRFVTAPIRDRLDLLSSRESTLSIEVRENYARVQRQREIKRVLARDSLEVGSLTQQAMNLRESLGAISPEDQEIVALKPRYDEAEEVVASWNRKLEQAEEEARTFAATVTRLAKDQRPLPVGAGAVTDALAKIESETRQLLEGLRSQAEAVVASVTDQGKRMVLDDARATWTVTHLAFETQYEAAKARSSAHSSKLDELKKIEDRRRGLQAQAGSKTEELTAVEDAETRHTDLLAAWREIQSERSEEIASQCSTLTALSGGLIRAGLEKSAGLTTLESQFRAAVAGSNLRSAGRLETFFERIRGAADPVLSWHEAMAELERLAIAAAEGAEPPKTVTTALAAFNSSELERIAGRVTPEAVMGLCLVPMNDHPVFEYKTRDGQYIAFAVASAGQQATALLRVLLNQEGPPLIIDQPEDDLDSNVMLEVVSQIWEAKQKRQLIFSSHNANLVVNGDAELVVCCDYRTAGEQSGGQIKLEGAIDLPNVRDEITTVMEGGERAFRLRKEKYGF
jgi:type III restriction enzyme